MDQKAHWEKVYATIADNEVGWFQEIPETSLNLIKNHIPDKGSSVIDIGSGNSFLTKMLFELGYNSLTILDISANALMRSKQRFTDDTKSINFIESNILDFLTDKSYEIWHDRAVFHFLTIENEINKYAEVAAKHINHEGYLILGTFSLTGPQSCSGLPIIQYDEEKLSEVFHQNFNLIECFNDVHTTPSGNPQNFIWAVFKRK